MSWTRVAAAVWFALAAGAPAASFGGPDAAGADEMTERVDRLLENSWVSAGVSPAARASDSEFLRRLSLDLTGVIPAVGEARAFLNDAAPDKRQHLVELLLARPQHATHLANVWRDVMLPRDGDMQRVFQSGPFHAWLREQFVENVPYNELVSKLLTATAQAGQPGPALFYTALELKPEELAASTSRIFLGVQIQCAQCHNHPFDHWTQRDFWGYAAFFARLQRPLGPQQQFAFQVADAATGEVRLPNSDVDLAPVYLGGETAPAGETTRRQQLAGWLASANNPFFAKATVNRVWALLFGRGIVDPVDDLGEHNPPSHPQLLDELAADFASHRFDLRRLFRILTASQAYQLSSASLDERPDQTALFARMSVKSLNAEQIYDCLVEATRRREYAAMQGQPFGAYDQAKQGFIAKFEAPTQKATEFQGGIPQALTMMNGRFVVESTDIERSDLLAGILDAPFMTDRQRVETIFLATLSRLPTETDRQRILNHVQRDTSQGDPRRELMGDLLWTLVNSAEFLLNH